MKRKKGNNNEKMAIGLAWYRPDQWRRLRVLATDKDGFHDNYEDWVREGLRVIETTKEKGQRSIKVDVDVEELKRWCQDKGLQLDGKARSEFVVERLRRMYASDPDVPAVMDRLRFHDGTFPRVALEAAVRFGEEIIPELLKALEFAKDNPEYLLQLDDFVGHTYAMFLLAQFREKRAYPLIVDFFSLPGETPMDMEGEVVTESLPSILASVSCGDPTLIKKLIEDDRVNEYVRCAALRGLVTQVACGEQQREEVVGYFQGLFHRESIRRNTLLLSSLVRCCTDLYPEETYVEIQKAFEEGLVETFFLTLQDVDRRLALGKKKVLQSISTEYRLITDVVREMEWWAMFEDRRLRRRPLDDVFNRKAGWFDQESNEPEQKPVVSPADTPDENLEWKPIMRPSPSRMAKIGRNEPCPCGSGRKYKKCCGA